MLSTTTPIFIPFSVVTVPFSVLTGIGILLVAGTCLSSLCYVLTRNSCPHLPSPNQGFLLWRLLHEPTASEIEKWVDELPNDGLFRYHGIYNRERIFIASPEAAKQFLTSEAYKFIKPPLQWTLAYNVTGHGLLIQEGDVHKQARKRFNPIFSPAQMRKWFPTLWKEAIHAIDELPRQFKQSPQHEKTNNLNSSFRGRAGILKLVSAASIDMIGHFGYDVNFNTIEGLGKQKSMSGGSKDPKYRFGRAYLNLFKMTRRGQSTLQAASLIGTDIALKLPLRAVKTIAGIMGLVRRTAEEIVVDHERSFAKDEEKMLAKDDMLSMLIKTDHFSHQELVEQTTHFLAAGTETFASTVTWAVHLLSRHPDMQTRLRNEIREHIPTPSLASADYVSESQFTSLKYLEAVTQEVLRFHSVNTLLWRECIEPATISGVKIPVGTTVVYSPWASNRDPAHWGPDARSFVPERWLDNISGGADHSYSFLTFGGGPRRCVGEQYARNAVMCLIAGLIGRFEFSPIGALEEGSDDGCEIGDDFALTLFKILEGWELNVTKVPGW